jgi:P27 family predicted phage terminase small subunit
VVDELVTLGCVTRLDGQLLAAWASAVGRAVEAEELINELTGPARLLVETSHGCARPNPLIKIVNDSWRAATQYAGLLGLTPSGRAGLEQPGDPEDDITAFLAG